MRRPPGPVGDSALTTERAIEMQANGLPNTFVPGRNLLFLTFAAALAYRRGIRRIVAGVCETDYSGYPDCRDDTIGALTRRLNQRQMADMQRAHCRHETDALAKRTPRAHESAQFGDSGGDRNFAGHADPPFFCDAASAAR